MTPSSTPTATFRRLAVGPVVRFVLSALLLTLLASCGAPSDPGDGPLDLQPPRRSPPPRVRAGST